MEDDHLNFLLLLFHLYRCKRFLSEAKDIWKLLGSKPSVPKDPAKKDAKARFEAFAMYAKAWKVDGIQEERDKDDGPV